jgi:hypothetical protein
MVAEAEEISNREDSLLNSRAQNSDGSVRRFFIVAAKNFSVRSERYDLSK